MKNLLVPRPQTLCYIHRKKHRSRRSGFAETENVWIRV